MVARKPRVAGQESPAAPGSPETAADHGLRLLRFLARKRREISPLLILMHDFPDPDALAAAIALAHLAEQRHGIQSKIAYGGVIGRAENRAMVRIMRIPVHKVRSADLQKYSHVALVDTQPRFKNNPFPSGRRATLVIDQHVSLERPAAGLALVDTGCGATCVIVAQALLQAGVAIPERIATALAYGILSDTLNLYRARRPDVAQTYLAILPRADMRLLARIQNPAHSRTYFLTLGRAVGKAVVNRGVILSHLGAVANPDLVSQMADFLLTYEHATWSACTGRYRGRLFVSLRAGHGAAQAGEVLRDIFPDRKGAGGHDTIGGGSFQVARDPREEEWLHAEQEFQHRLFKRLRRPVKGPFALPFAPGRARDQKSE